MAYKLAEEDKLCGVIYPTYEGFKPIPKATCEMLESKCDELDIEINCGGKKNPEEEPTPKPTPQPEPQPEPVPTPVLTNEELDTIVSGKLSTNTTLGNYMVNQNNTITLIGDAPLEDIEAYKKEITDKVGDIPELKDYTVEVLVNKIPGDNVGDKATGAPLYTKVVKITKPNGDVYQSEPMSIGTTTETNIDLLEALPRVEDKFSKIITKDGQVVEVPEVSNEDKRAFEDKIINDLKAKLPEGTTVEAVLEGAKYSKGDEIIAGKTNYVLNVRTTLNGVVSEQTYNVPHTEEAPQEEPAVPDAPEEVLNEVLNSNLSFGTGTIYGNVLTMLNNKNETITESTIKQFAEETKKYYEDKLNEGRPDNSKYKVEFTITQLSHIGDSLSPTNIEHQIFTSHIKITKPNGDVIEKDKPLTTFVIDTL